MNPRPYDGLTPETVLDAVESVGLLSDGRQLALNSFENRVYQVGIEEAEPLVVKFYRPERWSDAAIVEEHAFALALAEQEIPVVPPLRFDGTSLLHWSPRGDPPTSVGKRAQRTAPEGSRAIYENVAPLRLSQSERSGGSTPYANFRFALFRRQGGREPQLESADNLQWLGRVLARIHAVGAQHPFQHRGKLIDLPRVAAATQFLFDSEFVPFELKGRYHQITSALLDRIVALIDQTGQIHNLSIHGDCHRGNVLWTDSGPHFVDLDDCCSGPAVADFWMLLDGDRDRRQIQLDALLEGYEQFRDFDYRELNLIEPLRAMRMIEYAAWIARRWDDPAFPRNFAWYGEPRYWEDHIQGLGEQLERLDTQT